MIRPTDRWTAPSRGTPQRSISYAERVGAKRLPDVRTYLIELHRLCLIYGLDDALLVAHSAVETGDRDEGGGWRSPAWVDWLNPVGLGITDGGLDIRPYRDGIEAAAAHVTHLLAYRYRDDEMPADVRAFVADHRHLDPRYDDIPAAWRGSVRTLADLQGKWWTNPTGTAAIVARGNGIFPGIPDQGGSMALNMTKGLIPMPPFAERYIDVGQRLTSNDCRGYDWLGRRASPPAGLVLHRPQADPDVSNEGYLRGRCCPALFDFEVLADGGAKRFNRLGDAPSGWANGRVSSPYGDALAWLNLTGWDLNAVNRDWESCEVGGWFLQPGVPSHEDPITEAQWAWVARWIASRAHDYGITHETFPLVPAEGNRSYLTWHQEWTIGTLKVCPGKTLMDGTAALIERARQIMRSYQTGGIVIPEEPGSQYAPLLVPDFLTPKWINGGEDARFDNGVKVFSLRRRWQARVDTPRLQHSGEDAQEVGPILPAGKSTVGVGLYHSHGGWWILTEWGERLWMAHMTDFMLPGYPTEEAA